MRGTLDWNINLQLIQLRVWSGSQNGDTLSREDAKLRYVSIICSLYFLVMVGK
jgi:hypothetical protein